MPDDYSRQVALDYLRSEVDRMICKAVDADNWVAKARYIRVADQLCDSISEVEKQPRSAN
jgi:hypothetical protein